MRTTRNALGAIALVISISAVGGCRKSNILSRDEQVRIGREGSIEIEKAYEVSRNPADRALVERLMQRMVAANRLTKWPFAIKVLEDKQVNAVSLPGGPIYIFRGLLDMTRGNEDELAAVIGHEMGHIQKEHLARMYTQGVLTDLVILFGTRGNVQTAAQIVQMLAQLSFSRGDEYQSDSLSVRYTYRGGLDPNGLIRFFERLQRLERGKSGDVPKFLRTHPVTGDRISRARREIAALTKAVNAELDAEVGIDR